MTPEESLKAISLIRIFQIFLIANATRSYLWKIATFVQMKKPYIIGITGGSGSGKTYLLKRLLDAFEEGQICLVSQDNYYKSRDLQPVDEEGIHNFDTPSSIDFEG